MEKVCLCSRDEICIELKTGYFANLVDVDHCIASPPHHWGI